jgi:hypothetical protein
MSKVLTSWKEIARYFGRGVRTVQRWEGEFGLPVRRAEGSDHRAVMAVTDELDVWIRSWRACHEPELENLRREVAVLRAENASLKLEREERPGLAPAPNGFHFDHDLLVRSLRLVSETAELGDYSKHLVAWSRRMRTARSVTTVN